MKGISEQNGYYYVYINSKRTYAGKGGKGLKRAEALKAKEISERYINQDLAVGIERPKNWQIKTFKQLATWFMELPSIQNQKSFESKTVYLRHLMGYFKSKPLTSIEADTLEDYREYRLKQKAASGSIDMEMRLISAMYHRALKRKKLKRDWMPGEFPMGDGSAPRRRITDDEFKDMMQIENPDFRDLLTGAYESGMRKGEITKLQKKQVFLNTTHITGTDLDYITLGIFDTKNGTERIIPVSSALKSILERRMDGLSQNDFVFTHGGDAWKDQEITYWMKKACKKADIPYGDKVFDDKGNRVGLVFHCLRHTRICLWLEMGLSDEVVRMMSGHRSLESFRKYVHLNPLAILRLFNKIEEKYNKIPLSLTESAV